MEQVVVHLIHALQSTVAILDAIFRLAFRA